MPLIDYHEQFAATYDSFYPHRDVDGQVTQALALLDLKPCDGRRPKVLDFGCGTGPHVIALAQKGIDAVGFDASPAMIAQARAKMLPTGAASVRFQAGGFAEWCDQYSDERFDGVVSFANILNCMESPAEMLLNLRLIRKMLSVGARLIMEVWNGAAVFVDDPRPEITRTHDPACPRREIIRVTTPTVDRVNQRCTLHYRVIRMNPDDGRCEDFESTHNLKFLTPLHYRHMFELADLTVLEEFPRGRPGVPITQDDWYISYLLRGDG